MHGCILVHVWVELQVQELRRKLIPVFFLVGLPSLVSLVGGVWVADC